MVIRDLHDTGESSISETPSGNGKWQESPLLDYDTRNQPYSRRHEVEKSTVIDEVQEIIELHHLMRGRNRAYDVVR